MNARTKIILVAISVPIFLYFWPTALGGDTEFLIVQGQSMLPTIEPSSLVITKKAPYYEVDDIVAFVQKEGRAQRTVVHRIIDETERGFIIKGDNNPKKDPGYPTTEDIRGKVIFATPYVGGLLGLLRNPLVLLLTGLVIATIQMEQKRRKKRKEKLRRIRLGITKKPDKLSNQNSQKRQKKPDYSLFFAAITFNVLTYAALQYSITSHIRPEGDMLTGFLFKVFESSFASTVSFALYFVFILGLYFLAKVYEVKVFKSKANSSKKSQSTVRLLLGKESNPILGVAQFLWLLFILMSLFHLMAIGKDLSTV